MVRIDRGSSGSARSKSVSGDLRTGGCGCDENPFAEESDAVSRDEELRLECLVTSDKVSVEVGES